MEKGVIVLRYVGKEAYLPGIPSRDLTQADIDASGRTAEELIATGLYAPDVSKKVK